MFLTNFFGEKIEIIYPKVEKSLNDFEIQSSFSDVFLRSVKLALIEFSKTEIDKIKRDYIWKIANNKDIIWQNAMRKNVLATS